MKPSRSEFITVRGLRYHIRHWGNEGAPKLFMTHGWMDVSASFQFMVDCLQRDWHVIAPDWRGYGLTDRVAADTYWFPDYMGDLDVILDHYSPDEPVNLLGHSMGGNVVSVYAGVRPARIKKLINLEGIGMPATRPEDAPGRYVKWLDGLRTPPAMRPYATQAAVAARLQKNNPRLTDERAAFLSGHWAAQNAAGMWEILGDPAHRLVNPVLYRLEETFACWKAITAPVLWVEAEHIENWRWLDASADPGVEIKRRREIMPNPTVVNLKGAGHMVHHDQPEALAKVIEEFLS
ncbi:MAG: alpha/beta hydrolase [Pseudomonadota bacterium]